MKCVFPGAFYYNTVLSILHTKFQLPNPCWCGYMTFFSLLWMQSMLIYGSFTFSIGILFSGEKQWDFEKIKKRPRDTATKPLFLGLNIGISKNTEKESKIWLHCNAMAGRLIDPQLSFSFHFMSFLYKNISLRSK